MSICVLIVDDHQVVRSGLAALFRGTVIEIVAEASSESEAVAKTLKHRPDVVLLDVQLDDDDGFACLRRIREKSPNTPVVMLSAHDNLSYVARAVVLGACDYVLKDMSRHELISVVKDAASGKAPSAAGLMRPVAELMSRRESRDDLPLTRRETQVLRHLAFGLSNKDIARSMKISVETVKEHVQNLLQKLSVSDRTEAAVWAVRNNLA